MNSLQKIIFIIFGMALFVACNSGQQESDIKLNNGQKWEVNGEMKPHVEKAGELLHVYISQKDQDYRKLAENLKEQNNALVKSCTMKGEGHDELHKWLHPHMKLIEELTNAKDSKEAQSIIYKLEDSFETYHTYFR